MKKEWVSIFNLFSLTLSGFLIQAAVPVALGFLLIIIFGVLVSVLPENSPSLPTTIIAATLVIGLVQVLLRWIRQRFLFFIHVSYQSVIADLLFHGTRISPELSLIGQGHRNISAKCGDKKDLWQHRNLLRSQLQKENRSQISRIVFSVILPSLENVLISIALVADPNPLAESLQTQLKKYFHFKKENIPFFRILFLLGLAMSALLFIIVFVPIVFLFHSFGIPFLFGLVLSLALMLIFRQAFYFPLLQIALLYRFHAKNGTLEPGSATE